MLQAGLTGVVMAKSRRSKRSRNDPFFEIRSYVENMIQRCIRRCVAGFTLTPTDRSIYCQSLDTTAKAGAFWFDLCEPFDKDTYNLVINFFKSTTKLSTDKDGLKEGIRVFQFPNSEDVKIELVVHQTLNGQAIEVTFI